MTNRKDNTTDTSSNVVDILENSRKRTILPEIPQRAKMNISRKSKLQERANRLNAAMMTFIRFSYEKDGCEFVNLDAEGMVTITAPFTKTGYKDYKISVTEGRALSIIIKESQTSTKPEPLLIYKPGYTRWFIQFNQYRNAEQAVEWLKALNIDNRFIRAWRKASCQRYTGEAID